MLQHYFKIALRNISRKPGMSLINIIGLSVGVACCILILVFVTYEKSYDKWNPNADRIVRMKVDINFGGTQQEIAVSCAICAPDVASALPEVESWCRFRMYGSKLVKREGEGMERFSEEDILTVDSSFFKMFPQPVRYGDPRTCLRDPNTVAISVSAARKYFGSADQAVQQMLVFDSNTPRKVTAVYEDFPDNTHFKADFLLSMSGNREVAQAPPMWVSMNFHSYLMLRKGADHEAFRQKFLALSREKMSAVSNELLSMSLEDLEETGQYIHYDIQELEDIHLRSDLDIELRPNGNIQYVWIFGSIALFILLIACINFMNLATARSAHRAREIGMRKVLGSQRSALIRQFLGETMIMTTMSVGLGVVLAATAMPWFADLASRSLLMPWGSIAFWVSLAVGTLFIGFLAGSYPAFFLSAFEPIKVLKGQLTRGAGHGNLRSSLVVFQFAASIILIIGTGLMYRQINYIQNKKLGFNKEQVLILDDAYALGSNVASMKQRMLANPAVQSVSVSSFLPVPSHRSNNLFTKARELKESTSVSMQEWRTDYDYLETFGMEMVAGRFFDRAHKTDSAAIVLNETAAHLFGFDEPVGSKVYTLRGNIDGAPTPDQFTELTVIGVVKDFHWASLKENIGGLSFQLMKSSGYLSMRYAAAESANVIASLESNWKEMGAGQPLSYRFLDDSFGKMYQSEQRIGKIALVFAMLAIFISCLGLFGLANFMAEQRIKEIGIRKVLGASVSGIVGLLAKDFLKLVIIALVIGTPVAWYVMRKWLDGFAYRIDIEPWVFIVAGLLAVTIAFLTVSSQSIRAAMVNPVRSLKSQE